MPKPFAFMCGGLGAFPILLASFWAFVGEFACKPLPDDKALLLIAYGLSIGFLTIAMPMQFEGRLIAMAWAIKAAILTAVALRVSPEQTPAEFLSDVAQLVWVLALVATFCLDLMKPVEWRPIFNERFKTFAVLIGLSAFVTGEHLLKGTEGSRFMAAVVASVLFFWLIDL
ncbi:MAG: hypothetical protein NZ805_08865 [Armatimonadetes bacterium]|nr:hypothetical protein [Armatimonadota bacterium]MDW8028217.1 hypothetical protein [Armatimonadota bacterium]